MTEGEMTAAVLVKSQRFGIADEAQVTALLPSAITEFAAAHVWEFLTITGTVVASVAGRTYLNPPVDFLKLVAIGRPLYRMDYISPQEYRRRISAGVVGRVAGTAYTVEGQKIYLEPTPTGAVNYTIDYSPFSPNLNLAQIPDVYHPAIQKLLEAEVVPWENSAFPIVLALAEKAVNAAIMIDNEQPAKRERSYIEPVQAARNAYKYGRRRNRSSIIEEFGGTG